MTHAPTHSMRHRWLWAGRCLAIIIGSTLATAVADPPVGLRDDSPAQPETAVRAVNRLGFGVYRRLRATDGVANNIVISPVSLATAVSLLGAGANGDTANEFTRVLDAAVGDATYAREFGRLLTGLAAPIDDADPAADPAQAKQGLTIATRLCVDGRIAIRDSFARTAREHYRSGVEALDGTDPAATSDAVNAWVDAATAGRIPRIIDAETIRGTSVFLVNAVALQAGWDRQFLPARTATRRFHVAPGETVDVPMMEQEEKLRYARIADAGFGVDILELPYTDSFRMLILLPQGETTLEAVEERLSPDVWRAWSARVHKRNVTVWMPRFRIATQGTDMIPPLRDLGLVSLADDGKADFSRLASERLAVKLFRHAAMVAVDEKGTEAAAVTDTGMREVSAIQAPPVEFRADRPFLFIIDDPATGAILFLGRLGRP